MPGAGSCVQLAANSSVTTNVSLDKCIICGKKTDTSSCSKLYGTAEGRQKIAAASEKLQDHLVSNLSSEDRNNFRYHSLTCYANYRRQAQRIQENEEGNQQNEQQSDPSEQPWRVTSRKTRRSGESSAATGSSGNQQKKCIGCNSFRVNRQHAPTFRICEDNRAQLFLAAYTLNRDDVWERFILVSNIFLLLILSVTKHA